MDVQISLFGFPLWKLIYKHAGLQMLLHCIVVNVCLLPWYQPHICMLPRYQPHMCLLPWYQPHTWGFNNPTCIMYYIYMYSSVPILPSCRQLYWRIWTLRRRSRRRGLRRPSRVCPQPRVRQSVMMASIPVNTEIHTSAMVWHGMTFVGVCGCALHKLNMFNYCSSYIIIIVLVLYYNNIRNHVITCLIMANVTQL